VIYYFFFESKIYAEKEMPEKLYLTLLKYKAWVKCSEAKVILKLL